MSALALRLPDPLLDEISAIAIRLHISRSEYIRKSIEFMNKSIREEERKARLTEASKRVRDQSMVINAEFAEVEYDPKV
jgi:Arc/MetJ-type ribon-helix-helix transcriptional regulator